MTHRTLICAPTNDEKEYYSLVKKAFVILAPFYDTLTIPMSRVREDTVDFANPINGSRILDIGTGTGKQAFAKRGYNVFGIDLSETMLKVANKNNRYDNVKFEVADATNLPFDNNRFDVTCASFTLHDMPLAIRAKALKEMVRVTKPEGMIVIVDYDLPENRTKRFLIYHFVKSYEAKYYREFIKSDLRALLRKTGIKIRDERAVLHGAGRIIKGTKTNGN